MLESEKIRINFDLVPASVKKEIIADLAEGYLRYWENPDNVARYEAWKAEQASKGGGVYA